MNRRYFIHLSALTVAGLASCGRPTSEGGKLQIGFSTTVYSNRKDGHRIHSSNHWKNTQTRQSNYLIVGGGMAGLSAAYALRKEDFYLCEISENLGGTASSVQWKQTPLCHGAHYDLSYPNYYGTEALQILQEIGVVGYEPLTQRWNFVDTQYLIDDEYEAMSVYQGEEREGVLPNSQAIRDFFEITRPYQGKLMLPSRLIDKSLHHFNQESFLSFLNKNIQLDEASRKAMHYQMIDDFGGGISEVSALAGLYYYLSRPYQEEENPFQLFSPPQGNFYFGEKLLTQIPHNQLLTRHLVSRIVPQKKGFQVEILDLAKEQKISLHTRKIIYAGQKNALKYTFPQDEKLFKNTQYAPWAVVNFIVKQEALPAESYWQNEVIDAPDCFLGFVDSATQYATSTEYRVLTAYFCFPPEMRKTLIEIEENPQNLIKNTLSQIAEYFQIDAQYLANHTVKAMLKIMGHAMPIPAPGYLLQDQNQHRSHPDLVYAGVDNQRLPLLLEAIDSGIQAAKIFHGI